MGTVKSSNSFKGKVLSEIGTYEELRLSFPIRCHWLESMFQWLTGRAQGPGQPHPELCNQAGPMAVLPCWPRSLARLSGQAGAPAGACDWVGLETVLHSWAGC